ncbi:MAG: hypothetical protein KC421_28515 [Anaerolineales bacterium]|nr:hypothetical protein [Anaerolineales bacterium]
MSIGNIFAVALILLSIALFVAVNKGWLHSTTLQNLANIAGIVALVAAILLFIYQPSSGEPPGDPNLHIVNDLEVPVEITIEGENRGEIDSKKSKTFLIDSFPATVKWIAVNPQTRNGNDLGDYMAGAIKGADNNTTIHIDHTVKDLIYFFPKVVNSTNSNCSFIVDFGLNSVNRSGALIKPHTIANLGYYELHDKSNIYFHCEDSTLPYYIKWETNPEAYRTAKELDAEVEPPSGILNLTINE